MNFLRWLVLERILPTFDPEQLFLLFVVSIFLGGLLTGVLWPWGIPVAVVVLGFWITIAYVVVAQWLTEMKKEWKDETGGDK